MKVLDGIENLYPKEGSFCFSQPLSSLDHFVHTLVVTKFKKDITVLSIFEKVFVLADIVVFERSVNLDFGLELQDTGKNRC